jgi:hypothetical protein
LPTRRTAERLPVGLGISVDTPDRQEAAVGAEAEARSELSELFGPLAEQAGRLRSHQEETRLRVGEVALVVLRWKPAVRLGPGFQPCRAPRAGPPGRRRSPEAGAPHWVAESRKEEVSSEAARSYPRAPWET